VQDEAVAAALAPFASGGVYEHLLDGTEGGAKEGPEGDASYQVYELSQVRDLGQEAFLPLLLALFRRVERRLRADRPTLIVLEEVWSVLMEERFAARVKEWLLTLRKQNAAVVLAAHSPSQIAELPSRDLVVESCPTRIFLPNPDALEPSTLELYRSMGLRRREVEIIASATQKRDYYFSSRVGARLFDLGLGPLALEFVAGGKESREGRRRRVREMEKRHGSSWPRAWLEEAGLSEWAARYDDARRAAQLARGARLSEDVRSAGDDAPSSELATKGGASGGEGAGALSDTNGKWAGSTSPGPEDASS
jgi:type IV secretion system protein VirB4